MVYSPDTYSVPLSPLFSCTLVVSTLHHFSLHRRVGILRSMPIQLLHVVRWKPSPAVGLVEPIGLTLLGLALRSTLWSPILAILLAIAWRTPVTWIVSIIVMFCCIFAAFHWNSIRAYTFTASAPFYPSTASNSTVSPFPTLPRYFLKLFFFMAVWCTNTSSLVSFLLIKQYLFLTLNLCCDDLLIPTGRHHWCEASQAWPPIPEGRNVLGWEGSGRKLLGLSFAAHGCCDGDELGAAAAATLRCDGN